MKKSRSVSIEQVKQSAKEFLLLKNDQVIEVVMATYVANKIESDPLWLFLVGPPSSAKTEIMNALKGHKNVTLLSSLTPATLISGKKVRGKNASLLPKLTNHLLVVKDLGTLLTLHRESRAEVFSQLREAFDGQFSKSFGTGESVTWTGKLGLLAGCTPVIDKYSSINSLLGERFLIFRTGDEDEFNMGSRAYDEVTCETAHRKKFRETVNKFLDQFDGNLEVDIHEAKDIKDRVVTLAMFVARARSGVMRNQFDQSIEIMPEPERPARLTKQFRLLGMALAVVRGQNRINGDIYRIITKTGRDSIPKLRLRILETLWNLHLEDEDKRYRTKEIALETNMPTNTVKLNLENLHLLGLVNRDTESDADTSAYTWWPSELMSWLVRTSLCLQEST